MFLDLILLFCWGDLVGHRGVDVSMVWIEILAFLDWVLVPFGVRSSSDVYYIESGIVESWLVTWIMRSNSLMVLFFNLE